MVSSLDTKTAYADMTPETARKLETLRAAIDDVDARLIRLLGERFRLTAHIGHLKARKFLQVRDRERETTMRRARTEHAYKAGMEPRLAHAVYSTILQLSRSEHRIVARTYVRKKKNST